MNSGEFPTAKQYVTRSSTYELQGQQMPNRAFFMVEETGEKTCVNASSP
jgi:hypothetical protein